MIHQPQKALSLLLVTFALLGTVYSIATPIFEASDEVWHYPVIWHIVRTGKLPVQPLTPGESSGPWRQEGSQPPLYYFLGAAITWPISGDDLDTVRHLNPHVAAGVVMPDRSNVNLVVHNPAVESYPWRGTVLAVHLVRLLSVLLGTWAVYLTWALVRELYPSSAWIALAAAAVQAFTPMFIFISASVNNDALIVPLCTLTLLWIVRLVKSPTSAWWPWARLGLTVGAAVLTKASGLGLLPLVGAAVLWAAWHTEDTWRGRLAQAVLLALLVGVPLLLVAGWWFVRNEQLYGDWLGLNAFYAVLGTRDVPADLVQLWAERFAFAAGYWGNFGGLNVPLPTWAYSALNTLAILAMGGCLLRFGLWVKEHHPWRAWDELTVARTLAWLWPMAVFVSWIRWATVTWSSQGRLIFSALPLWSLALVLGLSAWGFLWEPLRRSGVALLIALLSLLSFLSPVAWIAPAYVPPPLSDAAPQTPLNVTFGETLRLRGYTLPTATAHPGGHVTLTLYWESLAPTAEDTAIFVHLLGRGDRIVAQRDTFPGLGLRSTTWLNPGEKWAETMMLAIPPMAYTPDTLTVSVGMYDARGRLPARHGTEQLGDAVRFGEVTLPATTGDIPNPQTLHFGDGIRLAGYDLSQVVVKPGDVLTVTLYWVCDEPLAADYTISVQLLDAQWHKAAQADSWPLEGAAPTSSWRKGQQLVEHRRLAIAADAIPGVYDLQLTLYRPDDNGQLEHLPITWQVGQMPQTSVVLTRVAVR